MFTEQTSKYPPLRLEADTLDSTLHKNTAKTFTFLVNGVVSIRGVVAITYNHASNIVAKELYGNHAYARRVEGINYFDDCSGYFQAYQNVGRNNEKPKGDPFHLQKVYNTYKDKPLAKAAIAG